MTEALNSPSEDLLDRYVNEVRSLCIAELEGDEVQIASARRAHDEMRAVYLASAATAPIACDEVMALAEAFERSANWLEQGVLEGSSRTHPLVGIADFRCASNALRAYATPTQPLPQAEPAKPIPCQRYIFTADCMEEDDSGDWVRYSDITGARAMERE